MYTLHSSKDKQQQNITTASCEHFSIFINFTSTDNSPHQKCTFPQAYTTSPENSYCMKNPRCSSYPDNNGSYCNRYNSRDFYQARICPGDWSYWSKCSVCLQYSRGICECHICRLFLFLDWGIRLLYRKSPFWACVWGFHRLISGSSGRTIHVVAVLFHCKYVEREWVCWYKLIFEGEVCK